MTRKATTPAARQSVADTSPRPTRPRRRKEAASSRRSIGELLRERRAHHGWTLSDVSEKTGISTSALSKIENGLMSPTYHTIIQLCSGLDIEIGDLISSDRSAQRPQAVLGRRSISRQQEGQAIEDGNYRYTFLCSDVAHKRIIPMVVEVKANSFRQIKELWSHVGEEYVYVLDGEIDLLSELYEPIRLGKGRFVLFRQHDGACLSRRRRQAGAAAGDLFERDAQPGPDAARCAARA